MNVIPPAFDELGIPEKPEEDEKSEEEEDGELMERNPPQLTKLRRQYGANASVLRALDRDIRIRTAAAEKRTIFLKNVITMLSNGSWLPWHIFNRC